jgi:hypothetical protein
MKNTTDNDTTIKPSPSTDHSETIGIWIGISIFTAFFILDWQSGWPI